MVGLPADKNWAENIYMPWPNFHPSFSESIFLLLAPYSVDLLQIGQRPCRLYPLAQSSSLFWSALPVTGTPSFSLLASPFPAAPGVHPAAPPRTSLPPAHRAPGKDTIHREPPPLKVAEGQGKWGKAPFFFTASYLALQELMCSQPTCDRFLLCQLRFVILRFPLVLRVIMDCFFFRGVSELGDNILLFGGVSWAGWAETETDGGHRQEWMCLYAAKWAAIKKPNYIKWRFEILKIPRGAQ